jgi:hypothetical protein
MTNFPQSMSKPRLSHDGKPSLSATMDPTTRSLSEDFAQLSVGDLNPPPIFRATPSLARVSRERDLLTDDDHKPLDAELMKTFSAFRRHNEEPDLPALLSHITLGDKRLVTLPPGEAEDLLTRQTSINVVLRSAWKEASFKEVRQLGAFRVSTPFLALIIIEEILWPLVREAGRWSLRSFSWDW